MIDTRDKKFLPQILIEQNLKEINYKVLNPRLFNHIKREM